MSIEAECLALAERQALVPCPQIRAAMEAGGGDWVHSPDCGCEKGEVRGPLALSVVRVVTLPCKHRKYRIDVLSRVSLRDARACSNCGTEWAADALPSQVPEGRALRDPPGQVPCPCGSDSSACLNDDLCLAWGECKRCGDTETVAGTDEASQTARDEACGRLLPVVLLLTMTLDVRDFRHLQLQMNASDYPGAMEALREALTATVPVEAT